MSDCYAVLLDIVGIQNYIFRSNKLKENLGASYLLKNIYTNCLASSLCEITDRPFEEELQHLNDWKESDANTPDCTKPVDIGYIGGGNALLFFQNANISKRFINIWTKYLLINTPGLTTAVAFDKFPESPEHFSHALKSLFEKVNVIKNIHSTIILLPRHGITAECARSELSAEIYNPTIEEYVSADVNARIKAATVYKEEIEEKYKSLLKNDYCFTDELDELGGIKEEDSHIAIVHIDGNDIGKLVRKAKDLKTTRYLSKTISDAIKTAFEKVI